MKKITNKQNVTKSLRSGTRHREERERACLGSCYFAVRKSIGSTKGKCSSVCDVNSIGLWVYGARFLFQLMCVESWVESSWVGVDLWTIELLLKQLCYRTARRPPSKIRQPAVQNDRNIAAVYLSMLCGENKNCDSFFFLFSFLFK